MKYLKLLILSVLFIPLISFSQVKIKGQVLGKDGEKVIASIFQYGSCLACDFYGDFEITIDELGGTYTVSALGYYDKAVTIKDSTFQVIHLQERKYKPRKYARDERRKKRYDKKDRKRAIRNHNGCCFVSGTMILMADGTEKCIEKLNVGDSIQTYDFVKQNIIVSSVSELDVVVHDNLISITLESGVKITNTADHPYYVFGKGICSFQPRATLANYGISANQLEIGDKCYLYDSGALVLVRVLTIEKIEGTWITYNISGINNNNNFFANGILVNNESISSRPFLTKSSANFSWKLILCKSMKLSGATI